ncbi:cell wall-binding repeat-containing protein [Desulfosporosinus metallidurans]|uniref:N-acetylmuramoyl-L-alanine amidase n=1 Tax=Desulfosporosinus metallidurans TaxID=1888891 RepID=A0A1Q8QXM6_9FIRM|nr:cell wall-binding repeat-containing protein [Desulfosporosinus metallidurans]OLN32081.1 N-acetylmuramoyl-L-alanine amidase [Desulfosporosinus metallidurans]
MKKLSLNLMAIVLCILITTITLPRNTYASSVPSAPTNLTATVASSSLIYLKWDPVSDASYYYVYRASSSSGTYTNIGTVTTTNYSDASLSIDTTYYYKVKAVNSSDSSSFSAKAYATTSQPDGVPDTPADLTATAASSTQIDLTWDPVSYAVYYYVYRATSSSGTYTNITTVTTSNFSDTSVSVGTTYYYKVQAVNSFGSSSYSSKVSANTTDSVGDLSAPTALTATVVNSTQINLTWKAVSSALYYYVYRSTSSSGTYTMIGTSTSAKYNDTSISIEDTYYYKVKATNGSDSSSYSSVAYATTSQPEDVPDAPAKLTATLASSSQIDLTWDPVSFATSYYVYRATSSSGTYTNISTVTTSSYSDLAVSLATTYYYKIKAVNSFGSSDYSSKAYVNPDDYVSTLSAPTNLTATVVRSSQIYLNWDPVSNTTYYYVYRATSSSGTYSNIGTSVAANYSDASLSADTTYYYKVKAVNGTDSSALSSKAYATTSEPDDVPAIPTGLTAKVTSSTQIDLTWEPVTYAVSYYVYRATSSTGTYTSVAAVTTNNFSDTSAAVDTTYYYKIQAYNNYGTSSYSTKVSANTADVSSDLSAPTNLTATVASSTQIDLTWEPVSNATSYYVYRATSSAGTYANIATVTTTNYSDSNLSLNTTYYYKVQAINSAGSGPYSSNTQVTTSNTSTQIPSERLAGADMYETSAEVAKSGWKTSYYALIVSGENFTDALCSAPLAQKYNAPLLLTSKDTLNEQTKTQLSRLKVKNVMIIGGVGVISSVVEQSIKNMGIGVSRIAGNDRYETSIKIAQSMGQFTQAVIASGDTFPDALSIAPIAAMKGIPILLTPKDSLPDGLKAYLTKTVQSTYVVGGTGVVSENVLKQLPSPKRLSGINRYETNISIINEFANELDFDTCYVSTGEQFADALAGSALATLSNSPVILVSNPVDQSTIDFFRGKIRSIKKVTVFGGTAVVPESSLESLNGTTGGSDAPSTPTNITATSVSSSQINLTWDSVSGATSYYVYGAASSSGTYTHIATVTTTSLIDTGLSAATTYYYKVQAVNSAGSSSYSPIAYAKTNES